MRYSKNQTLLLEPEHESVIVDEEDVEKEVEPIRVNLEQRIHSDQNPFITYWEVKYLRMTPNHNVGDTRVLTENMLLNYEITDSVQMDETTEKPLAELKGVDSKDTDAEATVVDETED
jgi:hypothetical protein